jgi:hypothetical protein
MYGMLQAEKLRIKKQKAKAFTDNKNAGKVTCCAG